MSDEVAIKMEHIQKIFLEVGNYMRNKYVLEDLIAFLDAHPPEFRSVAYESASMELATYDLSRGTQFQEWEKLYSRRREVHSFHLDIGLGWAFAKAQRLPVLSWASPHPYMRLMVFDGMGYYYGLFRGRRTVRNHLFPPGIEGQDVQGFDQGLGRRLWYIAQGEVKKVTQLIQGFPTSRRPDLWRGVGIACGYVGGSKIADLELLLVASGENKDKLCTGVALAAMSRNVSGSVTDDIKMACRIICDMPFEKIVAFKPELTDELKTRSDQDYSHWVTQLESWFE